MKTHIVFINGAPESGKDSFVKFTIKDATKRADIAVFNLSSIDCVRDLLGITVDQKDAETRKCLAVVGAALEEYSSFRSYKTAQAAWSIIQHENFSLLHNHAVVYIHVREQYMMQKMKDRLTLLRDSFGNDGSIDLLFTKLYINKTDYDQSKISNLSDQEAVDTNLITEYNYVVDNNSSLTDLATKAKSFLDKLKANTVPVMA